MPHLPAVVLAGRLPQDVQAHVAFLVDVGVVYLCEAHDLRPWARPTRVLGASRRGNAEP